MQTKTFPIRFVVGIGNQLIQGFAVVYERLDGTAGRKNIWFEEFGGLSGFEKVRFSDEEESHITFTLDDDHQEVPEKVLGNLAIRSQMENVDPPQWMLKEVVFNRNSSLPVH